MPLENATKISELVPANPLGSDGIGEGDDHLRLLKEVLQKEFPDGRLDDVTQAIEFANIAAYKAFTELLPVGKVIHLLDRQASFTVIAGIGTANTFSIIESTTQDQSISIVDVESTTLKNLGAVGDGVVDNKLVIEFADSTGLVTVGAGDFASSSVEILSPLNVESKGNLRSIVGGTITIRNTIDSTKQFIFNGVGAYALGNNNDQGENARQVHASWFGAFPTAGNTSVDVAPNVNKAFASLGNTRESIVDFDIGNYTMSSSVDVTRGGWVRGSGTRNTVFKATADGYIVFNTVNVACKLTDIQFEVPVPLLARNSEFIKINNGECNIQRVNVGQTKTGIVLDSNNCKVSDILAAYGQDGGANSSAVEIRSGSGNEVSGILMGTSSGFGPEQLVLIGGTNQTGTISNTTVSNINHITPSRSVGIHAFGGHISLTDLSNLRNNGFAGVAPDAVVKILAQGAFDIDGVMTSRLLANSRPVTAVDIVADGTGTINNISIGQGVFKGTGDAVKLTRNTGDIENVTISPDFNALSCANILTQTGNNIRNVVVSPIAEKSTKPAYCYDYDIADDDFVILDFGRSVFTGVAIVTEGKTEFGQFLFRAASSPTAIPMIAQTANVASSNVPLNGTTGVDGKLTIAFTNKKIYIENRLGGQKRINLMIMTGT